MRDALADIDAEHAHDSGCMVVEQGLDEDCCTCDASAHAGLISEADEVLERERVLSWEKPVRAMDVEAWKAISADCAPPGVYTPNMSAADRQRWKAKLVGAKTDAARVEIRKAWGGALVVIVVRLHDQNVTISQNGKLWGTFEEFAQLVAAVEEARQVLLQLRDA